MSDAIVSLSVGGELDMSTATEFELKGRRAICGEPADVLLLDMSGVSFIDAAGVGALIAIRNCADRAGRRVIVVNPSRCVRRILELTRLTETFMAAPSTDEAACRAG